MNQTVCCTSVRPWKSRVDDSCLDLWAGCKSLEQMPGFLGAVQGPLGCADLLIFADFLVTPSLGDEAEFSGYRVEMTYSKFSGYRGHNSWQTA